VTDVAVNTLRIRGPHARRLAAVAARALPAALDRALADVPDAKVPSIHVLLDLDVAQYDDATLATLWADAIRAEVLAAEPARRSATEPPTPPPIPRPAEPAGPDAVLVEARRWLAAPNHSESAVPAALLRLGDPETARAVAAALDPHEWSRLLGSLSSALAPSPHHDVDPPGRPDPDPAPGAPAAPAAPLSAERTSSGPGQPTSHAPLLLPSAEELAWPTRHTSPLLPPAEQTGPLPAMPEPPAALGPLLPSGGPMDPAPVALELLAALDELMPPGSVVIDPAMVTRAAGLVLLYPWLTEHCRRAERLHPRLDPLDIREAALAALVAPHDLDLADDLLVGFLAGRPDLVPRRDRTRVPLAHEREVQESAAEVLASYVSLLPGFKNSSAQFIRENWIARRGVLDLDRDPALLTAATHPLDVVLLRLPYPVGLLKTPWSPPLSVRFRP
jgi:hypothetical protein